MYPDIDGAVPFRRLMIENGYGKSANAYKNNGRVKRAEIVAGGGVRTLVVLPDRRGQRYIDLPAMARDWVQLRIDDVYPGARFADTCLSLFLPDFEYEEELLLRSQGLLHDKR